VPVWEKSRRLPLIHGVWSGLAFGWKCTSVTFMISREVDKIKFILERNDGIVQRLVLCHNPWQRAGSQPCSHTRDCLRAGFRYWACGAPKPVGPPLNSLPHPAQWPGAGRFFVQPLPLPASRPPPRSMPRTAPCQRTFSTQGPAFSYIPLSNIPLLIHE